MQQAHAVIPHKVKLYMKNQLTPKKVKQIIALAQQQKKHKEIAIAVGVGVHHVFNTLAAIGHSRKRFNDIRNQEILHKYQSGANNKQLAAEYGITIESVRLILIGLNGPKLKEEPKKVEIIRMLNENKTTCEIANKVLCSPSYIYNVAKENHIIRYKKPVSKYDSLNDEKGKYIIAELKSGRKIDQLAAELNVPSLGIRMVTKMRGYAYQEERLKLYLALLKKGKSVEYIATKMHCTVQFVRIVKQVYITKTRASI